jgi:hypothetical protein
MKTNPNFFRILLMLIAVLWISANVEAQIEVNIIPPSTISLNTSNAYAIEVTNLSAIPLTANTNMVLMLPGCENVAGNPQVVFDVSGIVVGNPKTFQFQVDFDCCFYGQHGISESTVSPALFTSTFDVNCPGYNVNMISYNGTQAGSPPLVADESMEFSFLVDAGDLLSTHNLAVVPNTSFYKRHVYQNVSLTTPFTGNVGFIDHFESVPLPVSVSGAAFYHVLSSLSALSNNTFSTSALAGGTPASGLWSAPDFTLSLSGIPPVPPGAFLVIEELISVPANAVFAQGDVVSKATLNWEDTIDPGNLCNSIIADPSEWDYMKRIEISANVPMIDHNSIAICQGSQATVTLSGANTYAWSPAPTTVSGYGLSTAVLSPAVTTTYSITGYSDGPFGTVANMTTLTVVVNNLPSAIASAQYAGICVGDQDLLNVSATGGVAPYSYNWSPASTLSSSTVANPVASPVANTDYQVIVTDGNGCAATSLVQVKANASPTLILNNTDPICLGSNQTVAVHATLPTSGSITYQWSDPAAGSAASYTPVVAGTYQVLAITNGCQGTPLSYTVHQAFTASALTSVYDFCGSGNGTIDVNYGNGNGPFSFQYKDDKGNSGTQSSSNSPTSLPFSVSEPTTYLIYNITNSNGCHADNIPVSINVQPALTSFISTKTDSVCISSYPTYIPITVYLTGLPPYNFNLGSFNSVGATSGVVMANVYIPSDGTYTFQVNGLTNNNCTGNSSGVYTVIAHSGNCAAPGGGSAPCATAILSGPDVLCKGQSANLTLAFSGIGPFNYEIESLDINGVTALISGSTNVISVSPVVSTFYRIKKFTAGCLSTDYSGGAAITVTSTSSGQLYNDNPLLCDVSEASSVYAVVAGMLQPSSANSYCVSVSPLAGSYTLTSANALVAQVSPGQNQTYSLTQVGENCPAGCNTIYPAGSRPQTIVTVDSKPVVSLSAMDTDICAGESVNLQLLVTHVNSILPWTIYLSNGSSYTSSIGGNGSFSIPVSPLETTTYSISTMVGVNCEMISLGTVTIVVRSIPTVSVQNTSTCAGSNVSLTASGAASYSWYNGNALISTTNPLVVSPSVTTTYSVKGYSNGCEGLASATVSIISAPAIPGSITALAGPGANTTYSIAAVSGAAWYTWSIPAGWSILGGQGTASVIVNRNGNTTGWITVKSCNDCACSCPSALFVSGSYTLCSGQTTNINLAPNSDLSAYAFSWTATFSNGVSGTASGVGSSINKVLTTTATTATTAGTATYVITASNGQGGCNVSTTVVVNVNPVPTASITGSSSICPGGTATLVANAGVNLSYQWFQNGVSISGATLSSYTTPTNLPSQAHTFSVVVSNALYTTCTASAAKVLTVLPVLNITITPPVNPTSCTPGFTYAVTSNSPTSVGWSFNFNGPGGNYNYTGTGINYSTVTNAAISPFESLVTITASNASGCKTTTQQIVSCCNYNVLPSAPSSRAIVAIAGGTNISTIVVNGVSSLQYLLDPTVTDIFIYGTLNINVAADFNPVALNIPLRRFHMAKGAKIDVKVANGFVANNCEFKGMCDMWTGFTLSAANQSVQINNTIIRDAAIGISATGITPAAQTFTNDSFFACGIGFSAGSTQNNYTLNNCIFGLNNFTTNLNVADFPNIGITNKTGGSLLILGSTFRNLGRGIDLATTAANALSVNNCIFDSLRIIGNSTTSGYGIYSYIAPRATDDVTVASSQFTNIPRSAIYDPNCTAFQIRSNTFTNVPQVSTTGISAVVVDFKVANALAPSNQNPNLIISGNTFTSNQAIITDGAIRSWAYIYPTSGTGSIQTAYSIMCTANNIGNGAYSTGIFLTGYRNGGLIADNVVNYASNTGNGIKTSLCYGIANQALRITNNTVIGPNPTVVSALSNLGIVLSDAGTIANSNIRVVGNSIFGCGTGIHAASVNLSGGEISCNYFENNYYGVNIQNSTLTVFASPANAFDSHNQWVRTEPNTTANAGSKKITGTPVAGSIWYIQPGINFSSPFHPLNSSSVYTNLTVTSTANPNANCQGNLRMEYSLEGLEMDNTQNNVVVYPNPVTDQLFTIEYNIIDKCSQMKVMVTDFLGQQIISRSFDLNEESQGKIQIDTDKLSSGSYIVTLSCDAFVSQKKIVVVK